MMNPQIIGIVTRDILNLWYQDGKWQLPWEEIAACGFLEFRGDGFGLDGGLEELSQLNQALNTLYRSKGTRAAPIIYTLRLPADGGGWERGSSLRENFYTMALEQKLAEIVDVELEEAPKFEKFFRGVKNISSGKLIISHHNFNSGYEPEAFAQLYEKMSEFTPDIYKFAVCAQNELELDFLLTFSKELAIKNLNSCVISMGEYGPLSRVMSPIVGATMTYGFFGKKSVVPGQLGILKLRKIFEIISEEPYKELGGDELKKKIRPLL